MKRLDFIVLILMVLLSFSWTDPSNKGTSESVVPLSDSIQFELSCPLVLDIGTIYKDTTVTIDCRLTNRNSTPLSLNFSEGYGFRVPTYTRLIQPGESGEIRFSQPITETGKFTKSWNFELGNGDKKQILSFVIKGERKE
jgi:hypothetical protein